jgi:hypothetical protein
VVARAGASPEGPVAVLEWPEDGHRRNSATCSSRRSFCGLRMA